jgi:hypothetical protein
VGGLHGTANSRCPTYGIERDPSRSGWSGDGQCGREARLPGAVITLNVLVMYTMAVPGRETKQAWGN